MGLAEALADAEIEVTLPDDSDVLAEVTVVDEQTVELSVAVPAGLAPEGGRIPGTVWVDQEWLVDLPLTVHEAAEPALTRFLDGLQPGIDTSDMEEVCGAVPVETDGDGVAEVLVAGIVDGDSCARGCVAFLDESTRGWECQDECQETDDDLLCGNTTHFLTTSGDIGLTTTLVGPDRSSSMGVYTWSSGTWSGSGSTALYGAVVLGINTSKEEPVDNLGAVLELRGGDGRWSGIYQQGREPMEWGRIGTVSASTIASGKAWAGLFSDSDLQPEAGAGVDTWTWTVDRSRIREGGKLLVSIGQWSDAASAFVRTRDVEIDPPGFDIELATAAGQDMDGDGEAELVVQAWGDGEHWAWVIQGATNKSETSPGFPLTSWVTGDVVALATYDFDGDAPTVAEPTMTWGADGLCNTVRMVDAMRADDGPVMGSVKIECWDAAGALASGAAELSPTLGGTIGGEVWDDDCAAKNAPDKANGRGICIFGQCRCPSGYRGPSRMVSGEGAGSDAESAPLAAGDRSMLGSDPSGTGVVVARALPVDGSAPAWPRLATIYDEEDDMDVWTEVTDETGTWLAVGGTQVTALEPGDRIHVYDDDEDAGLDIFQWNWGSSTSAASGDNPQVTTVSVTLRVRFSDQSSARLALPTGTASAASYPIVFDDLDDSDEGDFLLGWRDSDGQAWLGAISRSEVLGQAEGDIPFLQGPVAIGQPILDPDNVLKLGPTDAGMVSVDLDVHPESVLQTDDLSTRFSDWDSPMEVPFESGEGDFGPIVMVTGDADGLPQTVVLPRFDDLTAVSEQVLHTSEDPASLPVPRITARMLPDAPAVVVSTTEDGGVVLNAVDGNGNTSNDDYFDFLGSYMVGCDQGRACVNGGDVNGDGLDDLLIGAGLDTRVLLSDGTGGTLDDDPPEAEMLSNFGLLLGGSELSDCDDSDHYVTGDYGRVGATAGPGRAHYGSITLR